MPRDIISINTTHYVSNNLYRAKLPKAVQFKNEINYHYIHFQCIIHFTIYVLVNMVIRI